MRRAAEQGHPAAEYMYGAALEYYKSSGAHSREEYDKIYAEAVDWYLKAAEHGHPLALSSIGEYYLSRTLNWVEAYKWELLAVRFNRKDSIRREFPVNTLKKLESGELGLAPLTQEEIATATQQADQWEATHPILMKPWKDEHWLALMFDFLPEKSY